jgi:hypothetical protein
LHAVQLVLCRSQWSRRLCMAALVGAIVNVIAVREIVILTFMHQVMGMMAAEGAVRFLRCPLVVPTTLSDALLFSLLFVLNFGIVAGETVMAVRVDSGFALGIGPVFFDSSHFRRVAFYQKQHATLHAVLCVLVLSIGTALVPRWRRSPTVQQARIVLEPACLVGVAMILFTHQHGADTPELASHPAIGTLMCLGAFVQVLCCLAHLSVPTRDGAPPDLTEPLAPADDAPALRMGRILLAYAYLVLAYFLYVDTYMECAPPPPPPPRPTSAAAPPPDPRRANRRSVHSRPRRPLWRGCPEPTLTCTAAPGTWAAGL